MANSAVTVHLQGYLPTLAASQCELGSNLEQLVFLFQHPVARVARIPKIFCFAQFPLFTMPFG